MCVHYYEHNIDILRMCIEDDAVLVLQQVIHNWIVHVYIMHVYSL